jgi:hypothetical protein
MRDIDLGVRIRRLTLAATKNAEVAKIGALSDEEQSPCSTEVKRRARRLPSQRRPDGRLVGS